MLRFIGAACMAFLLFITYPQRDGFTKYKAVEAYEVQTGNINDPTYAEDGRVMTTIVEYENVTVQIYSAAIGVARKGKTVENVAAVIQWKNRKCK